MRELRECHWTFDGIVGRIPSKRELRKLFTDLVRVVEMTPIARPQVYRRERDETRPWREGPRPAWGGMQLIAESHISIDGHGPHMHLDVFSCKDFQIGDVAAVLDCWLDARQLDVFEMRPHPPTRASWHFRYWRGALELHGAPAYVAALLEDAVHV